MKRDDSLWKAILDEFIELFEVLCAFKRRKC